MPETAATADTRTPSGRLALAASPEQIALGPLDGRYQSAVAPLVDYLSEAALNRDRVAVEVEWLIHLTGNSVLPGAGPLTEDQQEQLRAIVTEFDAGSVDRAGRDRSRHRPRRQGRRVLHRPPPARASGSST